MIITKQTNVELIENYQEVTTQSRRSRRHGIEQRTEDVQLNQDIIMAFMILFPNLFIQFCI